ncbi:MAG TPA: hypothetical protein VJR03_02225 [Nitrospira sp.]|nr:hypothetical protein [Nitrospira sp.]
MTEGLRRWTVTVLVMISAAAGCARMPYTTKTVHEDFRVAVAVQHEVSPARYSHPVQLTADQVAAILRNFSLREEQRLPLRWFAEEEQPKPVFREEELVWVSPYLVEALAKAGPEERAHFQLFAPGMNRAQTRNVTAGWVAVREPYLYLTIEYFHTEIPTRHSDTYYPNDPLMPPKPKTYLLFFEPGRFWVTDQTGTRALQFHDFLKVAPVNPLNP